MPDLFSIPQLNHLIFQLVLVQLGAKEDQTQAISKFIELEVQELVVLPKEIHYEYPSRVAIEQTLGGGFRDEGGLGLKKVTLRGSFGHLPRWMGLRMIDGWTRLKNFREKIFKLSHQIDLKEAKKLYGLKAPWTMLKDHKSVICVNFYDFLNGEKFSVNLDSLVIDETTDSNRLPLYTITLTAIGEPAVPEKILSFDPTLSVLLKAEKLMDTGIGKLNSISDAIFGDRLMKNIASGITWVSTGLAVAESTKERLKGYWVAGQRSFRQVTSMVNKVKDAFAGNSPPSSAYRASVPERRRGLEAYGDAEQNLLGSEEVTPVHPTDFDKKIDEAITNFDLCENLLKEIADEQTAQPYSNSLPSLYDPEPTDLAGVVQNFSEMKEELTKLKNIHKFFKLGQETKQSLLVAYQQQTQGTKPIMTIRHTVKEYETWESIGQTYNVDWEKIAEFNNLPGTDPATGTEIDIPKTYDPKEAREAVANNPVFDSHNGIKVLGKDWPNELQADENGGLKVLNHRETFLQGLQNILHTKPGTLPLYPNFGFEFQVGETFPREVTTEMVKHKYKTALESDARVLQVPEDKIEVEQSGESLAITGEVVHLEKLRGA